MANQSPQEEPQFEIPEELQQTAEDLIKIFVNTERLMYDYELVMQLLVKLNDFSNFQVLKAFHSSANFEDLRELTSTFQVTKEARVILDPDYSNRETERLLKEGKDIIRYKANLVIARGIKMKSIMNALTLIVEGDVDYPYHEDLIGVQILKNLPYIDERSQKYILRQVVKPSDLADSLYSRKHLPYDVLRSISYPVRVNTDLDPIIRRVNLENPTSHNIRLLERLGLPPELLSESENKALHLAYLPSRVFSLNSLLENIDQVSTADLLVNQKTRLYFHTQYFVGKSFLPIYNLNKENIASFPDLKIYQVRGIFGAENFTLGTSIESSKPDPAVNMALALKICIESANLSLRPEEVINNLLTDSNLTISYADLQEGIQNLLCMAVENPLIMEVMTEHGFNLISAKAGELMSFCSIILSAEAIDKGRRNPKQVGQKQFQPFPLSTISLESKFGALPSVKFLPTIMQSFIATYQAYPALIDFAEQRMLEKAKANNVKPNWSTIFFDYNKINEDYNNIRTFVVTLLVRDIENIVKSRQAYEEVSDERAKEFTTLQELVTLLQELDPSLYQNKSKEIQVVIEAAQLLEKTLNSIKLKVNKRKGNIEKEQVATYREPSQLGRLDQLVESLIRDGFVLSPDDYLEES